MIAKDVSATVPEKKNAEGEVTQKALGPVTIMVNYPETLDEGREWAGDEAILSNAFQHFKVSPIQSGIRALLKQGKTPEQIQDLLGTTVMGVAREGGKVDPTQAYLAKFAMAGEEEKAAMLDVLKDLAAK